MKSIVIKSFLIALFATGLAACDRDGPMENAGEKADEMYQDAKDGVKDAGDEIEDAADDVEDSMQ